MAPFDCEVQIHSLTSATEHNGSRGQLKRFDFENGRWEVSINVGQPVLSVKPANLSLLDKGKNGKLPLVKLDNGNNYEGEWLNGKMHGRGIYTWAHGDR